MIPSSGRSSSGRRIGANGITEKITETHSQCRLDLVGGLLAAILERDGNGEVDATDLKMFKTLIDAGASINTVETGTGYTPLHNAVLADWLQGVEALLSQSGCKLVKDGKGRSPIMTLGQYIFGL